MVPARKKLTRDRSLPTPATTAHVNSNGLLPAGICLVLAAIIFAVFGQTLHHQFINFDDGGEVYENPMVIRGLTFKGVVWAFTQTHSDNWYPLTWISHMLDCELYGLNASGHHLTNILIHTATVIVLFLVLRQMTGALWRSAVVAAVFAIHPLRVESVAWVAERKDVLSGLFFMLTIAAYVRYARLPWSPVRYGLVLLLFALGLMCKPMLVTLPLVLLLLDFWPLQRQEPAGRLVMEKLPLLAFSVAGCIVTVLAQSGAIQSFRLFSLPLRLGNALVTCMVYLGQMVWPAELALYYPYLHNGPPPWELGLAAALLAGFSALAWRERRTRPWLLIGWLWYLVMLLPVVGIIQVGGQAHADRYTYLPQIGIYMAVTWMVAEWGAKRQAGRVVVGGLMTGAVGLLMVCAWKQTTYWENSETVWAHAVACTTGNDLAFNNLGLALFQEGQLAQTISCYQQALKINPDYADAHINLANILLQKGEVDEATSHLQQALEINPALTLAHNNLGNILQQKGQLDQAILHFQEALRIDPGFAMAHYNLANALLQKGSVAEAVVHFQRALQIKPDDTSAENNLAMILATCPEASVRNGTKAVELAREANTRTGGENPIILHTLAAAFAEAGRFSEATDTANKALDFAKAQSNNALAGQLQAQLKLYQEGKPYHRPEQSR